MNGSPSSFRATSPPNPGELPTRAELLAEIDGSCRALVPLFLGALAWLVISSLFALLTSIKLHAPMLLANCPWLTYGHTLPAARDALVYGFASQAGLAVALWMLCRLGRTTLVGGSAIIIASLFWNLGVALGVFGILHGDSTGFEWLEFPRYASLPFIASYVIVGICALLTFRARREAELYPSQWYILAALFWFPWLYTSARMLLVWFPVRGAMQFAVNTWFANGLFNLWLAPLALAVLLYFIPKLTGAPLFSRPLAVFGFWTLAAFGAWGGLYRGAPLPGWMVSASVAGTVLMLVPLTAVVRNLRATVCSAKDKAPLLGFFKTSLALFAVSSLLWIAALGCPNGTRLSVLADGVEILALYGFVGLALFGAIHYIVPRLTGIAPSERLVKINYWCAFLGALLVFVPLAIGGVVQSSRLVHSSSFLEVMTATKPFLYASTLGWVLLVIGNMAIFVGALSLARECCRNCCCPCEDAPADGKLKPARAAR